MKLGFWIIVIIIALILFSSFFLRFHWFIWKLRYIAIGLIIGFVGGYLMGKKS